MKETGYRSLVDIVVRRTARKYDEYVFKPEDEEIIMKLAFDPRSQGFLRMLQQVHGPNLDRESNVSIVGDYGNAVSRLCTLFANHILGVTKPVKEKSKPVSFEQMIYNYVIQKIKQKYPNFKYLNEITQEYVMHVIDETGDALEIAPRFFKKIAGIIVTTYRSPSISNSRSVLDEHSKIYADLINIFGTTIIDEKTDAEVIYWVIQLNGIWNNADFMKNLGMSYDAVLDRVSKILNSHINSKRYYSPDESYEIYKIYKICSVFLRTGKGSLVRVKG